MKKETFVVAGASGRTGGVVADLLLRAGRRVRVLVRDPARGEPWRARGAEVAVASLADAPALKRSLEGAAASYLLSPQDPRSPDPIAEGWTLADSIARAIDGVDHVVFLSALGARLAEGGGLCATNRAAELRLAEARPAVTFLRAAYLLENWAPVLGAAAGGALPTFIPPERTIAMVSTRDVGAVAAAVLRQGPVAHRRIVELAGPRDYSPQDLAAVLATLVGRPVVAAGAPLAAVIPAFTAMGATPAFAEQVRQLHAAIAEGRLGAVGAEAVRGSVTAEDCFAGLLRRP